MNESTPLVQPKSLFRRKIVPWITGLPLIGTWGYLTLTVALKTGGEVMAFRRLVFSLGSTVPEWSEWNFEGAIPSRMAASYGTTALLVIGTAGWTWMAASTSRPAYRALGLLGTLIGTVASVLTHTGSTAWVILAATLLNGLALTLAGRRPTPKKPALTALGMCMLMGIGTWMLGDGPAVASHHTTALPIVFGSLGITLIGYAALFQMERRYGKHNLRDTVMAMFLSASLLISAIGVPELQKSNRQRQTLAALRLDELEASLQRHSRAEDSTDWVAWEKISKGKATDNPAENFTLAWLNGDLAQYGPEATRAEARARGEYLAEQLPEGSERNSLLGRMALSRKEFKVAARHYRAALSITPGEVEYLKGLAAAEIGLGNYRASAQPLALAALTDPREIFSPTLNRAPYDRIREQVRSIWRNYARELINQGHLSGEDQKHLENFVAWESAWASADGNFLRFLALVKNTRRADSTTQVAERLQDTLADPTDEKIGAIMSSGTALLTDRHINLGQCHEAFNAILNGGSGTPEYPASILIGRPATYSWKKRGPTPNERAEASLFDQEENLPVRLTTYGRNERRLNIPNDFLQKALGE